jgi:hemolysin activation/secretion protein
VGKGTIFGARVILPLRPVADFSHTAILGFDYKDFEETTGLLGSNGVKSPISYFPFSASYSGMLRNDSGATAFNAGVNFSFRGAVSDEFQFEDKRFKARGNYIFMTAGLERTQKLPADFTLLAKLDGQISDQPLIANEQFSGGGVESVRGYRESETSGDNAIHGVLELAAPDLLRKVGKERFSLTPYIFFDAAMLWLNDPLPEQQQHSSLGGSGFGLRGTLFGNLDFQTDYACAVRNTNRTSAGDSRFHFKVRYQF